MLTLNEMKAKRDAEIATVKDRVALIKRALEENKVSRRYIKEMRGAIRRETQINRVVKEDARAATKVARDAKRAERVAARIAKAEARLEALKQREFARAQKATKKSTKGVMWTAAQVAAMNAERGLA
jgi:hypothetical protein